jgi:hypothetical protein
MLRSPIAVAVFASAALAACGAFAACLSHPAKTHAAKSHAQADTCVDLNTVPQISAQIVGREPAAPAAKPAYEPPSTPALYEGPTLGMTKPDPGVRPTPTVGYHWNLQ